MVLREVDTAARKLVFYTDERSPKVAQMQAHPHGTLLCWSQPLAGSCGCACTWRSRPGLAVSSRWARMKLSPAAQDYLSPLPPGTPGAERYEPERATREPLRGDRRRVLSIDWLELHADGHRRALFGAGGAWLQP